MNIGDHKVCLALVADSRHIVRHPRMPLSDDEPHSVSVVAGGRDKLGELMTACLPAYAWATLLDTLQAPRKQRVCRNAHTHMPILLLPE